MGEEEWNEPAWKEFGISVWGIEWRCQVRPAVIGLVGCRWVGPLFFPLEEVQIRELVAFHV